MQQLKDELEAATLDRQLLELELEEAREQVSDLSKELESTQFENATKSLSAGEGAGDAGEKLKQALQAVVMLKSEVIDKDNELNEVIQIMTEDGRKIQKMERQLKDKSEQLITVSQKIGVMKEQLENSNDSSGMVETLTNKIDDLEEETAQQKTEISEMIALVDLNDRIIDEQKQSEDELYEQLDFAEKRLHEVGDVVKSLHAENSRYKVALRDMKKDMEDNADLMPPAPGSPAKNGEGGDEPATQDASGGGGGGASAQTLAIETKKTRSTTIKLALQTIESSVSKQYLGMAKLFLPESFDSQEHDAIALFTALHGLRDKSAVVMKECRTQFKMSEDVDDLLNANKFTIDQLSFAHNLLSLTGQLEIACNAIIEGLTTADETEYKALGNMYTEVMAHESALDELLNMMQTSGLGPAASLDNLSAGLLQIQRIADHHLNDKRPATCYAQDAVNTAAYASKALYVELKRLEYVFAKTTADGNADSSFGELVARIQAWQEEAREIGTVNRRAKRHVRADDSSVVLKLKEDTRAQLSATTRSLGQLARGLRATSAGCWDHMHGSATLKALTVGTATQISVKCKLDVSLDGAASQRAQSQGAPPEMVPAHASQILKDTMDTLTSFSKALEMGEFDDNNPAAASKTVPQWQVRGDALRAQLSESLKLTNVVEEKEKEIKAERTKALDLKKTISDQKVKLAAAVESVDRKKAELQRRIDSLQLDLDDKEQVINQERGTAAEGQAASEARVKDLEAKIGDLQKKMETMTNGSGRKPVSNLRAARLKIDGLEQALRALRHELSTYRGDSACSDVRDFKPLCTSYRHADQKDDLAKVSQDTSTLLKDLRMALASPLMVDITRPQPKAPAAPPKSPTPAGRPTAHPVAQMSQQAARLHTLQVRGSAITRSAESSLASHMGGGKVASSFSKYVSPAFKSMLEERQNAHKVGTVKIPKTLTKTAPGITPLNVDLQQLQMIHTNLVC